jgi:hypothetical protein
MYVVLEFQYSLKIITTILQIEKQMLGEGDIELLG